MLTRRRAKMATQGSNAEELSLEYEINNQLGLADVEESNTPMGEEEMTREANQPTRARGQSPEPQVGVMEMLAEMMRRQDKNTEEMNKRFEEQTKELKRNSEVMNRKFEEQKREFKNTEETIKKISAKIDEQIDAVRRDLQQQIATVATENKEQNIRLEKEIEEIKGTNESNKKEVSRKLDRHIKETKESRDKDRKEWQEAITKVDNTAKQRTEGIEQQVRDLKEVQQDTVEKLNSVSVEKGRRLDEITSSLSTVKDDQQRVQRRLEEIEQRPAVVANGAVVNKELTFDGEDNFPMEFLKELREIQEIYYPSENTKWLGRHLIGEAAVWWRIVRGQINNFQEFEEVFTEKYWGAIQQERVRDQLEYGRYNPNGSKNMVQYMEQRVLQCRRLIPVLPDRHLIKKLARHYDREIQIAVVTRGITNINGFESLLREYMGINAHSQNEPRKPNNERHFSKIKSENSPTFQRDGHKSKGTWQSNKHGATQRSEEGRQIVNSIVVERQANTPRINEPSTSTADRV